MSAVPKGFDLFVLVSMMIPFFRLNIPKKTSYRKIEKISNLFRL